MLLDSIVCIYVHQILAVLIFNPDSYFINLQEQNKELPSLDAYRDVGLSLCYNRVNNSCVEYIFSPNENIFQQLL